MGTGVGEHDGDTLIPTRVNRIRIVGTDIESFRSLPQFKQRTIQKLFGKPLHEFWVGGSSAKFGGEPETKITKVAEPEPKPKREVPPPTPPMQGLLSSDKKKPTRKTKDTSIGGNKKK